MAQCKGRGCAPWLSAGDGGDDIHDGSVQGTGDIHHGSVQGMGGMFTVAQCRGQRTCNVAQCKGRVTRTVTQRVGRVARAGAGAEPPQLRLAPERAVPRALLSLGREPGCSAAAGRSGSTTAWPPRPVLHKDDVVESTTSRPLHTVGTYCEAEPGREGSSQGQVGVWQQHPPRASRCGG